MVSTSSSKAIGQPDYPMNYILVLSIILLDIEPALADIQGARKAACIHYL
jgi:hypothetical protein